MITIGVKHLTDNKLGVFTTLVTIITDVAILQVVEIPMDVSVTFMYRVDILK